MRMAAVGRLEAAARGRRDSTGTGWSICIDSGQVDNDFGQIFNDSFSSHSVKTSDGFC